MGMTTYVQGFVPPDAKFKKMLAIYEACEEAGVETPVAVDKFFNGEEPDPKGVVIDLENKKFKGAVVPWMDASRTGFEVHIDKLPKDIKIIRFVNSY